MKRVVHNFIMVSTIMVASIRLYSQSSIIVYADFREGDSIHQSIQILTNELNKAIPLDIITRKISEYNSTGFLLVTSGQARKLKIKLPGTLPAMGNEGIFISSDKNYATLVANTAFALKEAVYMYLEQLGFRWLMPGKEWNIVPILSTAFKKMNILTRPDYEYRWIANGHGYMNSKKIANDFDSWATANRMPGIFSIKVGHSYDEIVMQHLDTFKQHPEYFGQPTVKGTVPTEFKFNVANNNLVNLVINNAFSRYELQQRIKDNAPMVSMEPSDGGGSCTTPECLAIGTPSDQVFYLVNKVAKAFQRKYPGVWVGSYAYNEHILPTKYKLEPNVFVMITNGFNRSEYTTTQLMQLWKKKASKIGVYEYLSVYEWDNDLPGQVPAAKIDYLKKIVKKYYDNGARSFQGESVMGWVNRGPGQYILSKLLWNRNVNVDSVRSDFFIQAYGNTAPLISKLYKSWENYPHRIVSDNDLADWLSIVNEAYDKAASEKIRNRIDFIKVYLHYLVLYKQLKENPTEENLIKTINYAFRTFEITAFATLPTMVSLPYYSGYKGMGWYDNPVQKWKDDKRTFTNQELQQLFQEDLHKIKRTEGLSSFSKSNELIKLEKVINIPDKKYSITPHAIWDITEYVFRIDAQSDKNYIEIKSGLSAQPPTAKDVEISIYPINKGDIKYLEDDKPLLAFKQHKKNEVEKFSLKALKPGTYRMLINDLRKMYVLNFSAPIDYSLVANADYKLNTTSAAALNVFYFVVPNGVKKFQVSKTTVLSLKSPTGRIIDKQDNRDEIFLVDVQPGEEGLWIMEQQAGSIYLDGVPPYLGDHPSRMLVPSYLKK